MFKKFEEISSATNTLRGDFMDYVYSDDSQMDALLVQSILNTTSQIDDAVREIEKECREKRRELIHLKMMVGQLEQEIAQMKASD